MTNDKPAEPAISLKYIYVSCNDMEATRRFYVELLGLQEQSYRNDEEWAWLVCKCQGFELMFFPAEQPRAVPEGWTAQPGWQGGTLDGVSWSVEYPAELFAPLVQRLKDAGAPHFFDKPQWCQDCYWSFPVKDPSGYTVEVYTTPRARPASTIWGE